MSTATRSSSGRQVGGVTLGADLGILIIRLVIGALFIGHGTGKLFGWFGQGGIEGTGAFFEQIGYSPGENLAVVAGIVEVVAGVLLVLGFLMPLAAAIIIGDMMNAAWYKSAAGFWVADEGYEYELVLIFLALALVIIGPGLYSIDRNRDWFRGRAGGVAVAVILGVVSGVIMLVMRD